MIKLLQTGDLHLKAPSSEDSDYSLECLEILIKQANEEAVDAVLLCGDMFDREKDYSDSEFCQKVVAIFDHANMPLYYIPGNHESQEGNYSKMEMINWGQKIRLLTEVSLESFSKDNEEIELLAIPHSLSYDDYTTWDIGRKVTRHRIAMAHGSVPGFTFLGDEADAGVLNPSIFVHYDVSHVFLGHIHLAENIRLSNVDLFYAGSPRPVRRREVGVRGYNIVAIGDTISVERKKLVDVGVGHNVRATVMSENWVQQIEDACQLYGPNDRIRVVLEGMAEDIDQVQIGIDDLTERLQSKFRRINIDTSLEPLEDLIQNPFYKKVYDLWLERKPDDLEGRDFQVWLQMLNTLKFVKEDVLK